MNTNKVWFITGAGRGMGVDFARAALEAGHSVVATGRNPEAVARAIGKHENLLIAQLDITNASEAEAAVQKAVERFGRIDVLLNNAGNFFAGYFEELSMEDIEKQMRTNLFGPMIVTRAVLPQMRKQRSGHIIALSSLAGVVAGEYASAYAASKFAMEGWIEALQAEVAPFGINTTIVNPGYFRTELLTESSTKFAESSIPDYAEKTKQNTAAWKSISGKQPGNPAKIAKALVQVADVMQPPRRFVAGADAVEAIAKKAESLKLEATAHGAVSTSMDFDEMKSSGSQNINLENL